MNPAAASSTRSQPLSDDDIAHYHREGWVLARSLVPADAIARVRSAASEALPGESASWTPIVFEHASPDERRELHCLLAHPAVIDAAEQLLGPQTRVFYGMVAMVPPGGGRGLPWHQDNQYTHVLHHALNTFIAVTDIAPEQCTLWVSPRSHLAGVVPSRSAPEYGGHREALEEPKEQLRLPYLRAGDACIFHRNTLHRSIRNDTDRLRIAYAAQYMEEDARDARTGLRLDSRTTARSLQQRWGQ